MRFNKPVNGKKRIKYNNLWFDSNAELAYYVQLLHLEKANQLKIISLQPKIYLSGAKILYKPDFLIEENGKLVYVDVKGFTTPIFAIKKRLWKFYGPSILRIVTGKKIENVEGGNEQKNQTYTY
jgi:predicted nuclease of restriction endonuclease-like RecB superfamily